MLHESCHKMSHITDSVTHHPLGYNIHIAVTFYILVAVTFYNYKYAAEAPCTITSMTMTVQWGVGSGGLPGAPQVMCQNML